MSINREEWAKAFLGKMGWPVKERNLIALICWEAAEGGPSGAKFNPLNSTQPMPGSTPFNWNGGFPVQNYISFEQGLEATRKTIRTKNAGYAGIRHALQANAPPRETLTAVEGSDWGTGGLAKSIVDDVKHSYDQYAHTLIGQ